MEIPVIKSNRYIYTLESVTTCLLMSLISIHTTTIVAMASNDDS